MLAVKGTGWLKTLYVGLNRVNVTENTSLIMGKGTTSSPYINSGANKNFFGFWNKSTAATGTTRGRYERLYLSGGAGGECLRTFTTVESDTPADTCNGIHNSLSFGTSAGNITGMATAIRNTIHIPGRAINGTISPVQSEFYGDAASGAIGGVASFFRAVSDGNSNLKDSLDDNAFLLDIQGLTAGAAHLFRTGLTAATVNAATTCALRIRVGSTTYYIPIATATA